MTIVGFQGRKWKWVRSRLGTDTAISSIFHRSKHITRPVEIHGVEKIGSISWQGSYKVTLQDTWLERGEEVRPFFTISLQQASCCLPISPDDSGIHWWFPPESIITLWWHKGNFFLFSLSFYWGVIETQYYKKGDFLIQPFPHIFYVVFICKKSLPNIRKTKTKTKQRERAWIDIFPKKT